jgi:hypothetical protein
VLESKDHQLALINLRLELRDHQITELEAQLVDVHKGQMKESRGVHTSVHLLMDNEKECRQLRRRC